MISVVIPCYNASNFIKRAIDSVMAQDYNDWEIILVNNNSTDNTLEILLQYKAAYPDRIFVFEETQKGGCAARNKGLKEARGRWVQFLDADDELLSSKFSRQIQILEKSKADFIAGNFARVITVKGRVLKLIKGIGEMDAWSSLISAKLGITSANLFSVQKLIAINGWDEQLSSSQEYDMMFRLLSNNAKVTFDKDLCAFIYYEENSVSRSGGLDRNIRMSENYVNLRMSIQKHLKEKGALTKARNALIHKVVYAYLIDKQNVIPEYVHQKLSELDLDIPIWEKMFVKVRTMSKHCIKKMSIM